MKPQAGFKKFLEEKGLRSTSQRDLIVGTFFSTRGHVSAEELYSKVSKRQPSIGLVTVYRTLRLLCEAGLAREHHFGDASSRYEPLSPEAHHDHLICTECGRVEEFESADIEKLQEGVANERGFEVASHKLELYGRCRSCRMRVAN